MNRKKILCLLYICFFIILMPVYIYATSEITTMSAEVKFSTFTPAEITHNAIISVSSINGILKTKSSVDFGSNISASADLLYYLNDQTVNVSTVVKGSINHKSEFYISTPKLGESNTSISYKLKITLVSIEGNISYLYWPSSATYQRANIVDYSSTTITSAGGTVTFESGNQQYGNT
ncbi:MAG: hypothetical protein PHG84_04260, partial [Endomicrobiaceae bacterium]|nr:hypothetical protein [Endomicrobiaceae bacterium]